MHWTPLSGAKFEDVFGPSARRPEANPASAAGGTSAETKPDPRSNPWKAV